MGGSVEGHAGRHPGEGMRFSSRFRVRPAQFMLASAWMVTRIVVRAIS